MKKSYEQIRGFMDSCQEDVSIFLNEMDKIDYPQKKKAQMILKIASAQIKKSPEKQKFIEIALNMLTQSENDLQISDAFLCALGYEKIKKYDTAIQYYEKCIDQLPDSSMRSALRGMKFRVLSKKEKKDCYFDLAAENFSKAALQEEKDWKRQKWEVAAQEMVKQKKVKWE